MRLTYFGHHMHEVSQQAERFHVEMCIRDSAGTLEEAAKIYTEVLGLKATGTEEVKEQGVATVFVPCGETLIELLVDILSLIHIDVYKRQLHGWPSDRSGCCNR